MNKYLNPKRVMKNELTADEIKSWREHRIERIKALHPVYAQFDFDVYSNEKIAEMFQVLVIDQQPGDQSRSAQ